MLEKGETNLASLCKSLNHTDGFFRILQNGRDQWVDEIAFPVAPQSRIKVHGVLFAVVEQSKQIGIRRQLSKLGLHALPNVVCIALQTRDQALLLAGKLKTFPIPAFALFQNRPREIRPKALFIVSTSGKHVE